LFCRSRIAIQKIDATKFHLVELFCASEKFLNVAAPLQSSGEQLTNVFCTFPVAPCSQFSTSANSFSFNSSETRIGWTIGGGLEWAFWNNWSVRLEYDYLDFGARNVNFTGAITGGVVPGVPVGEGATVGSQTIGVRQRISEVKLGLSYLFNYGPRF